MPGCGLALPPIPHPHSPPTLEKRYQSSRSAASTSSGGRNCSGIGEGTLEREERRARRSSAPRYPGALALATDWPLPTF